MSTPQRLSPIHTWFEQRAPVWGEVAGMPLALRLQSVEAERQAMQEVALCDLSCLRKLGVKGRESPSWLQSQQIEVPEAIYQSSDLADGGLVVRLATDEFFLESGIGDESVSKLTTQLDSTAPDVFSVPRQDATFWLIGPRAVEVLAQTCSIDFRQTATRRLVMTRIAGTSCSILPDAVGDTWACRLWVDYGYAAYLWEVLVEISGSLGGSVIGSASVFPELQ